MITYPVTILNPASTGSTRLIMSVKTDNSGTSGTDQFTIPLQSGTTDFTVYYDGQSTNHTADSDLTLTFPSGAGTYDIEIEATSWVGFQFANGGDRLKVLEIKNWGNLVHTSTYQSFYGCSNMTCSATDTMDCTGATDFRDVFRSCSALVQIAGGITTTAIINSTSAFRDNTSMTTAPAMDCSTVTVAQYMFYGCSALTSMDGTYAFAANCNGENFMRLCTSLTDIPSALDTSVFGRCDNMFANNTGFTTVRAIDFSSATTLSTAFQSCSNMTSCGTLTTSASLTSMNACFNSCASMGTMPSVTNTSAVTTFFRCFRGITSTVSTVPAYDTSAATSTQQMFENSTGMNGVTMPTFNLGAMTNGTNMFAGMNMSTASYDDLLVDIELRNSNASVVFHGGNSTYTDPSAAATARAALIADHSWTITDGGAA